jgi:hypothetical protein
MRSPSLREASLTGPFGVDSVGRRGFRDPQVQVLQIGVLHFDAQELVPRLALDVQDEADPADAGVEHGPPAIQARRVDLALEQVVVDVIEEALIGRQDCEGQGVGRRLARVESRRTPDLHRKGR